VPEPLTIDEILTRLAEAPPRIAALTAGLALAELRAAPGPEQWSANDVLAHLRACADVWGGSILRIITEDQPAFRGVNPRVWIHKTNYPELDFGPSCRAYAAQRADLLAVLGPLPPEGWSRTATVTAWGQAYERNVLYYAERMALHERPHLRQIEEIITAMAATHR
jgi:hypothetical protein